MCILFVIWIKFTATSVSAAASTTATAMSTSFTVVSTSISLDSIPPAEDTQKEEGTSAKEHESGDNKASKTVAEKREKMASSADGGHMTRAASGNGSTADDLPGWQFLFILSDRSVLSVEVFLRFELARLFAIVFGFLSKDLDNIFY